VRVCWDHGIRDQARPFLKKCGNSKSEGRFFFKKNVTRHSRLETRDGVGTHHGCVFRERSMRDVFVAGIPGKDGGGGGGGADASVSAS
jgi:hypothetical protein